MKRILASFLSLTFVSSSMVQVVCCGPATFPKLLNRQVDTHIYRGVYSLPMTSWSSASTIQLSDSIILTNNQDTLLATDQYNNFEGDLADSWISNENKDQWRFHVREGQHAANWTALEKSHGGQKQVLKEVIKPQDFFNSFRFVFNPNNASSVVGVWQQIMKYSAELLQFIDDIRDPQSHLYSGKFVNDESDVGLATASYYVDRAILAFNLYPQDPIQARNQALSLQSTEVLVAQSFANGEIINNGQKLNRSFPKQVNGAYNLQFNLLKTAPYFESIGAFLSFAPLPDVAVDYLKSEFSGRNYGTAGPENFGFRKIYYSGAYVVSAYNPTLKIELIKNQYYFNKDNLSLEKLIYSYVGNVDTSRQRFYFETQDLSEVVISSNDLGGWKKYVGPDYENPRFQGTNLVYRPNASTFALFYNYAALQNNGRDLDNRRNRIVSQRSVRAFIRYAFNRSEIASFYSKALDGGNPVSRNLRNTWTAKNTATLKENDQEIDYTDFLYQDYYRDDNLDPNDKTSLSEAAWLKAVLETYGLEEQQFTQWSAKYGLLETPQGPKNAMDDGFEPYLKNDLLGTLAFFPEDRYTEQNSLAIKPKDENLFKSYVQLIGYYDENSLQAKLNLLQKQVNQDLDKIGITEQVILPWWINGAASTGINNYIKNAVRTFNFTTQNEGRIKLKVQESTDAADYVRGLDDAQYSLVTSGWVPDYSDPYGYLHTLIADGDLANYTGFSRLFTVKYDTDSQAVLELSEKAKTDGYIEAFEDLKNRLQLFMNDSAKIDLHDADSEVRYPAFANIENYGILESILVEPSFIQVLDNQPYLSYVDPFSRSTFSSGQAIYRFVGVTMVPKLWTHEVYQEQKRAWEVARTDYTSKYPDKNGKLIEHFDGYWPN